MKETDIMRTLITALGLMAVIAAPATAQKLGKGGTGVDEASQVPRCPTPLGTIALVEERSAASPQDELSPTMRAFVRLAEAQNGGSTARVDPLPLLKLLVAQSNCFYVVDRGEGFDALQRERELASGGSVAGARNAATLRAADYLLTAKVIYTDSNAGGSGLGGLLPGGLGLKSKKLESQTMLTLVEVKTGLQQAVASGSARKKDLSILGGGILAGAGIGGLGGSYTSTDIGKITSLALLDAFRKLTTDAQARIPVPAVATTPPAPVSAPLPAVTAATAAPAPAATPRGK
jgi:hypothetical protein